MRSFSLFALAAAAIAPFVAAAPAPAPVTDLVVRGDQKGVPAILTALQVKLEVDIVALSEFLVLLQCQSEADLD